MTHVSRQLEQRSLRQMAVLVNQVSNAAAIEVFHDQEERTTPLFEGIDRHDVGVDQAGGELRLTDEALFRAKFDECARVKLLDGDGPVKDRVFSLIDDTKAPATHHVENAKFVEEVATSKEHHLIWYQPVTLLNE